MSAPCKQTCHIDENRRCRDCGTVFEDIEIQKIAHEVYQHVRPSSARIVQTFAIEGRWRVYFNRHGAAPLMWCIAPESGEWEIAVPHVQFATIAETVYRKKDTPDEDDGKPSAWIAVEGILTVLPNMATIGTP